MDDLTYTPPWRTVLIIIGMIATAAGMILTPLYPHIGLPATLALACLPAGYCTVLICRRIWWVDTVGHHPDGDEP